MRKALAEELSIQMSKDNSVYLLTADLGFMLFEGLQKQFPKRFINVGVAESNMIGLASGLALTGKKVFVYSIATFATYRTFENIRNDICQHNLPVFIIGSGAGLSYSDAGPSHHALEDISLLRAVPNLNIYTPSDPYETKWAIDQSLKRLSPAYIRIGKNDPIINKRNQKIFFGKANIIKTGADFLLLSMGNISAEALNAVKILSDIGLKGTLITYPTIKPFDFKTLLNYASRHKQIFSVEEHSTIGGLGSCVSDILATNSINVKHHNLGLPDIFIREAASQEFLREKYGISAKKISNFIKSKLQT